MNDRIALTEELFPGFEMTAWQGLLAPARTPQAIVDQLATVIQSIAKQPAVIEKLSSVSVESTSTSPAQLVEIIKAEQGIYAEAVKAAGLARP